MEFAHILYRINKILQMKIARVMHVPEELPGCGGSWTAAVAGAGRTRRWPERGGHGGGRSGEDVTVAGASVEDATGPGGAGSCRRGEERGAGVRGGGGGARGGE